jgi:hypothetical protein
LFTEHLKLKTNNHNEVAMKRIIFSLVLLLLMIGSAQAQTALKPFILPFRDPPGVNTWLLGQAYGNTTGAFNSGAQQYTAGQYLHFGLDFSAPCGTPVVAMADGIVDHVDNFGFGSRPHNLLIRHDALGYVVLYGHLLETPSLIQGQAVKQGDVVGLTGSPDSDCDSRPHLHLEVRSMNYFTTYNPVNLIDANWDSLALVGSFSRQLFQVDLFNARRWLSLDEQPNVQFGGARLNDYSLTYPPPSGESPTGVAPIARNLPPITAENLGSLRQLGYDMCCWVQWWHPTDPDVLYTIDGTPGSRAVIFQWSASAGELREFVGEAPPPFYSADFSHTILRVNNTVQIRHEATGETWFVNTGENLPMLNADNSRLMWMQRNGTGETATTSIFISDSRGVNTIEVLNERGLSASWLDANRLLLFTRDEAYTTVGIADVTTGERYELGRWYRPRGFEVAPGGSRMVFYLMGQPNPADNGMYIQDLASGTVPQKVDWFGAYQWRDNNTVYYIPFNPDSAVQQLFAYDVDARQSIPLTDPQTQPFSIMNGQWSVNADGSRIVFRNGADRNLWFIEIGG